jgi:hypothetical protein
VTKYKVTLFLCGVRPPFTKLPTYPENISTTVSLIRHTFATKVNLTVNN